MKSALPVFLLVLCLAFGTETAAQDTGASPRFSVQKTVVYPVRDPAKLSATIAWYSSFFGSQPTKIDLEATYPYATYHIDGVEVRLDTNPQLVKLKEPVFYWMLPTSKDVEAKYNTLNADRTNRFERTLFQKFRNIEDGRPDKTLSRGTGAVTEVAEFVVVDPAGNQVGVINNPVYPPKIDGE
ncbi:hypothetical protein [Hymenobacter sediminicola]|uniref:VOC family protein n=1 Tax=Hymenobacter sediminicola TaxID=2761579 RepID=A0A7G7W8H6_9BACT|nr:hypothetical protein [Hymenobacter sediminicola]QNH62669.1 hypothetical protein H4317_02250 [Hymenobacter sediminicola]